MPETATSADTGGIVSLRLPATVPVPNASVHAAFGVAVEIVTVAAVVPLLNAATASCPVARSRRETTSTASFATRTTEAPVASSGCASRKAASAFICAPSGLFATSKDDPLPIGGEPTRVSVCQSLTCVGNRSWRAALSPPEPIIPTSSP